MRYNHVPVMFRYTIFLLSSLVVVAQQPEARINPQVEGVVNSVSEDHMAATLKKLEGFGTRYVLSSEDDPTHGIGAARRWIHDQFVACGPRLEVSEQTFPVKKGSRQGLVLRDVELANVIAVLPGTIHKDRYLLVTGHYDSLALAYKSGRTDEQRLNEMVRHGMLDSEARELIQLIPTSEVPGVRDPEKTAAEPFAPGVTDDGSGVAAVLELARAMSKQEYDKTVVFIAFSGEEIGLEGSKAYAAMAQQKGMDIEAVLNNDIIGSDVSGDGRSETNTVRVFGAGPEDSPSRALLRYTKQVAERYVPSMNVEMVFRGDRFLRGGDHLPFVQRGYGAVRFTSASEKYENQHTATDTFANTSVPYAARVARMNAAVLASLALAPAPPALNWDYQSGPNKGGHTPLLTRGKSGYDAVLHWQANTEPDLAGYAVVIRSTTSPVWQRETWVGNVTSYTMPDLSIDDVVIGVKAVDRDGNQSLVSAYLEPVLPSLLGTPATQGSTAR